MMAKVIRFTKNDSGLSSVVQFDLKLTSEEPQDILLVGKRPEFPVTNLSSVLAIILREFVKVESKGRLGRIWCLNLKLFDSNG